MTAIPGYNSTTVGGRKILYTTIGREQGPNVVLQSDNADSGSPTTRFRRGNVIALRTGTGEYVEANDANADHQDAASVNTLVTNPGSGGWDGVVTIEGNWGSFTVTLSGANSDAAVAAAIIAAAAALNPESQAPVTAADATGSVSITNIQKGAGTWLKASHATVSTMFGSNAYDQGNDPDILVTDADADLVDENGSAASAEVQTLRRGHFIAANLLNLTAEARAVLEKRGCRFTA